MRQKRRCSINFHGRSLLNESDSQNQAVALVFAQEKPAHFLQRTSDRFHVHAFVQIPKWSWYECSLPTRVEGTRQMMADRTPVSVAGFMDTGMKEL